MSVSSEEKKVEADRSHYPSAQSMDVSMGGVSCLSPVPPSSRLTPAVLWAAYVISGGAEIWATAYMCSVSAPPALAAQLGVSANSPRRWGLRATTRQGAGTQITHILLEAKLSCFLVGHLRARLTDFKEGC